MWWILNATRIKFHSELKLEIVTIAAGICIAMVLKPDQDVADLYHLDSGHDVSDTY